MRTIEISPVDQIEILELGSIKHNVEPTPSEVIRLKGLVSRLRMEMDKTTQKLS